MFFLSINKEKLINIKNKLDGINITRLIFFIALFLAICATYYSYSHDIILSYGDAESHINIAKRVVSSLTPGFAQLGGIWLPIPHLLMIPFVESNFLWRSGLAGSIVAGICYIISCIFIYKIAFKLTANKLASFFGFLIFASNPNLLYLQSTPMSEVPFLVFFIISIYYLILFLQNDENVLNLILASEFGFFASLSRYDGWFLVMIEAFILGVKYFPFKQNFKKAEGMIILFSTMAFLGILIWLFWDYLILGNALYFSNSQYSAATQQKAWLMRDELPAHDNIFLAFLYFFVDSMSNVGVIVTGMVIVSLVLFVKRRFDLKFKLLLLLLFFSPFIFNVISLYAGQSVIFIPHLTPVGFEWRLFNVRYGILMLPTAAFFAAFLFSKVKINGKLFLGVLLLIQLLLYGIGYSQVLAYQDGVSGLSSAKRSDAEHWMASHYDNGMVLIDDYARSVSIIRSGIPMQNVIYVGNHPYWEISLKEPETYAKWIIIQQDDAVWNSVYTDPEVQGKLYKYFNKVYTSPDTLIFKKIE